MSGLEPEVRKRTDALDSLGNTTAATGKGFAIGSAALTGLALLASYIEEVKIGLERLGTTTIEVGDKIIQTASASFSDFMAYYEVHLMNPKVLVGMFIGSMMTYVFCGLTMNAVGRAAQKMVEEVRRQFREIKGIMTGKATPDYARCVEISTKGAQVEMLFPSLLAIIVPTLTGLIFGVAGVMGLLIGGLSTGFITAIFMANSGVPGTTPKNTSKKEISRQRFRSPQSHSGWRYRRRSFQRHSGPSLNILIKLMSMVSIVMAGLTVAWSLL